MRSASGKKAKRDMPFKEGAHMPELPADISVETTGWLITLSVAFVFVVAVAVLSYWLR
jgi:hypothetical protein